jgi:2-keto-3-deoxy-L-rhamnonate aldolase RhmA
MTTSLRARIRSNEPTLGTFMKLGSTQAAEVRASAGPDGLATDLEHGASDEKSRVARYCRSPQPVGGMWSW